MDIQGDPGPAMTMTRAGASLRAFSAVLSLEELVAVLGRDPTRHYRKGDIVSKRNPRSPVRKVSAWILESPLPEDVEVHEHIAWLCDVAADNAARRIERVRSQIDMDIFCFCDRSGWQGAIHLPAPVAARLGDLGLDVSFDIYADLTRE